jgi:hypothetical protein
MQRLADDRNIAEWSSRGRQPTGATEFGQTLKEWQLKHRFHIQTLVARRLLTRTQAEEYSRLSNNADAVLAKRAERRSQIATDLAHAIVAYLCSTSWRDLDVAPSLEERLRDDLLAALENDHAAATRRPLANDVVNALMELTGRPLPQLALDATRPGITFDQLVDLWRPRHDDSATAATSPRRHSAARS